MQYSKGMTSNDLFLRSYYRYPEKTCLVDKGQKYTYREVNRESNRLANAMRGLEYGRETRWLCSQKSARVCSHVLACPKSGQ